MIYNRHYIDVEKYVDMDKFDAIHPDICSGFVIAKDVVSLGYLDLYEPNKPFVNLDLYKNGLKPVWYLYDQYKLFPVDHPIKVAGSKFENENDLILYITYALGAHNPYKVYQVISQEDDFQSINFLSTIEWINNLTIFTKIKSAYFLIVEGGGTSIEHSDPEWPGDKAIHEFVYIRSDLNRPFYIRSAGTTERSYLKTRAVYFNDHDYHGSDPCPQTTYMLRVDGEFTEEFRQQLRNENV